jgi:hypothetical protein
MRQLRLFCFFLLVFPAVAAPWRFSNPQPHGNNILDMALDSAGNVWQVGDRGRVYTSPDLDTWYPHESGVTRSLRGLVFFKGKAFISTEEGGILSGSSPDALSFTNLGTLNWLEGIAASADMLVTVGDNGAIYSSGDGLSWSPRGNSTDWLRGVAYGLNQFIAVGEDGTIATSSDGTKWDKRTSGTTAHLNKVAFINDRFWIVGDGGVVLTNNFRMSFFKVNVGVTNTLFAVAGNTNEIVIAGDSTLLLGNLQTGSWSQQADANSPTLAPLWPYYSALWDGRLFLVGGRTGLKVEGFRTNTTSPMVWYSETQPTRNWLWSATRATNFYAACGAQGTVVTSEDGVDWSREVTPAAAASQVLLGIGGNNNALVAVGTGGIILRAPNVVTNTVSTNATGQVVTNQTSLFGVIWEQVNSPTVNDLQAVAANESTFILGGAKGTILTSADGVSWQPRSSGVTNFLSSATPSPQGWIVTGSAGIILRSADGAVWNKQSSGVNDWVYSVRYAGGKLVAVGENGLILTSDDGASWNKRNSGTTEWLNDVTFAQNTWWVAGSSGLILTSPDLATWTITRSITSKSLYSAVTDGQQLIMSGLEGVIIRNQLVPVRSPVNFVTTAKTSGGTLFLFDGVVDQSFVLEESSDLNGPWTPATSLEIISSGGTLISEQPVDGSRFKFFRTRLLAP